MIKHRLFGRARDPGPKVSAVERTAVLRRAAATVLQLVDGSGARLIGIAAPTGGEGASLVAETLAGTISAHNGGKVVLIDGVRDGSGAPAEQWLQALKQDGEELGSHLRRDAHEGFDRLQGFHPGGFPDSRGAQAFAGALRSNCDIVVIVLPPLLRHPEALSLAAQLDGVILVLEAERTRWEVAREAKQLMDGIGVKLLGVILNKRRRHIPDFLYRLL